jgi:hypothetical protein
MRRSRSLRLAAVVLAVTVAGVAAMTDTAEAKPILKERFRSEGGFVLKNFCGVSGLTIAQEFVAEVTVLAVPHGPDGQAYFVEHAAETNVYTNVANGQAVTQVSRGVQHDLDVRDNGDGTLTILVLATGNDVLYGPDGKAIARNPGQIRFEVLVDHSGTPTDPFDDEFLADRLVKGSTGRSDDYCAATVAAIGS